MIFNSFTAQIGDSIKVKSKIIKKEKAKEKYTDAIAEGNAAIFAYSEESRFTIHMGNIPPENEVILYLIQNFLVSSIKMIIINLNYLGIFLCLILVLMIFIKIV